MHFGQDPLKSPRPLPQARWACPSSVSTLEAGSGMALTLEPHGERVYARLGFEPRGTFRVYG